MKIRSSEEKHIEQRRPEDLKPHPLQTIFGDLPKPEFMALVLDMEENGLNHEVEILPDGTIIAGHQRVRAALHNAWDAIDCWIRYDLAELGEAAIMSRLMSDNHIRRQISPLSRVRQHLQFRREQEGSIDDEQIYAECRQFLAAYLGVEDSKTLRRWLKVIRSPVEVQNALERGDITQGVAEKVADLPPETQALIVASLNAGEDPAPAVKKHVQAKRKVPSVNSSYVKVLKFLEKSVRDMGGREGEVTKTNVTRDPKILRNGLILLNRLLRQVQGHAAAQAELIAKVKKLVRPQ